MSKIPRISDAEWTVMDVLWKKSPLTGNEVFSVLSNTDWTLKTLKTLLNRLVNKKAISYKQDSRIYHYFPIITREECMQIENSTFLRKFYQGSVKSMFTGFVKSENLTREDIDELKDIIEKYKEE